MSNAATARVEAATAEAVAVEATRREETAAIENVAVAGAMERVEAAEETAEQIALAALHTAIGTRIEELATRCETRWTAHEQVHLTLNNRLDQMAAILSAIEARMAETPQQVIPAVTAVSSNPETSEVTAVMVDPVASDVATPVAPAVPEARAKRLRML